MTNSSSPNEIPKHETLSSSVHQETAAYFANLTSSEQEFVNQNKNRRKRGQVQFLYTSEMEAEAALFQRLAEGLNRNDPQTANEALRYLIEVRTRNGRQLNEISKELQKSFNGDSEYMAAQEKSNRLIPL